MNKKECPKCNQLIGLTAFNRHISVCNGIVKNNFNREKNWIKVNNTDYVCKICGKSYSKSGIGNYIKYHFNYKNPNLNKPAWNRGLKKKDYVDFSQKKKKKSPRICKICGKPIYKKYIKFCSDFCKNEAKKNWKIIMNRHGKILERNGMCIVCGKPVLGLRETCSSFCYKKVLRKLAQDRNLGGWYSSKHIPYLRKDGLTVILESTYEVVVAKSLDKNNINWIRPKCFKFLDEEGVLHRYYPDFYLIDHNVYLDPKNRYLIKTLGNKINLVMQQNKIRIIVLSVDNLEWESIINFL